MERRIGEGGIFMYEMGTLVFDDPLEQLKQNILHVDMDAFYASLAERDNPALRGKPVLMARHPNETNGRGIVATANYEARKYGVHSGMPTARAYELCPEGIFVPVNHPYIRSVSRHIHSIFQLYTDKIQRIAYDEAFLDLTMDTDGFEVAQQIQKQIKDELSLTCSIGVSYNKLMAKLASDYKKPNGITVIESKDAVDFLDEMDVQEFHGIGPKTTEKLNTIGIYKISDIRNAAYKDLKSVFGSGVESLLQRIDGIDPTPVNISREAKSSGNERTYHPFLKSEGEVYEAMVELIDLLGDRLLEEDTLGTTVILKLRDSNFKNYSKRKTLDYLFNDKAIIYDLSWMLWEELRVRMTGSVRLMGITLTGLDHREDGGVGQTLLF